MRLERPGTRAAARLLRPAQALRYPRGTLALGLRMRLFHHAMIGVTMIVGKIQGSQTGIGESGPISTLTTVTAVSVAMVPASILVKWRAMRRGPLGCFQ